jgi:hypothetical protein
MCNLQVNSTSISSIDLNSMLVVMGVDAKFHHDMLAQYPDVYSGSVSDPIISYIRSVILVYTDGITFVATRLVVPDISTT